MRLGNYEIEEYLGSWYEKFPQPGLLDEDPDAFVNVEMGINSITSIRKILEHNKEFKVTDEIGIELKDNMDFYKVSLVSSFSHGSKFKFRDAMIKTELVSDSTGSGSNEAKPYVYSISPLTVNEKVQVTKEFVVSPELQLTEAINVKGGSFTSKKEYQLLHPIIVGYFAAGHDARWEYKTTEGIDDIIGSQLVEFIIRQPANTQSKWRAFPKGQLKWIDFKQKFKSFLTDDKLPLVQSRFKTYNVPRDPLSPSRLG